MEKFLNLTLDLLPGIRVTKKTDIKYENENVKQTIKGLKLHSITTLKGVGYKSTYDTYIDLVEGDILIFDEQRGYIKPVEKFYTVEGAIKELSYIKE